MVRGRDADHATMRNLRTYPLALVLVVATGCGSAEVQTTTSTATAPTTAERAVETAPEPWYRLGLHGLSFSSPTGNIRCETQSLSSGRLFCTTLNNAKIVSVGVHGDVSTNWQGGRFPSGRTLPYGGYWTSWAFVCWSRITDVRCRSIFPRDGFRINRQGVQRWQWSRPIIDLGAGTGTGTTAGGTGGGYTVVCADGWVSQSGGIQGACSSHGGIG